MRQGGWDRNKYVIYTQTLWEHRQHPKGERQVVFNKGTEIHMFLQNKPTNPWTVWALETDPAIKLRNRFSRVLGPSVSHVLLFNPS